MLRRSGGCRSSGRPGSSRSEAAVATSAREARMVEVRQVFDDSAGYERFMGRWSRAVGEIFLDWIAAAPRLEWLDVGCGTGIFTELIAARCQPLRVTGVDPAQAQIDLAASKVADKCVGFRTGDAQALPFADASFDVATAALV